MTKVLDSDNLTAFAVALLLPVNVALEEKPISPSKKIDSEQTVLKKQTVFEDVEFSLIRFKAGDLIKEIGTLFVSLCVKAVMWYSLGVLSQSMDDFSFTQSAVYSYFFYFHLSTIGTIMDFLVLATLNIKCSPAFDSPFVARSMTIFWSQKWNLVAQHMLKDIFFDCLAEGSLVARPQYYNKPKVGTGRVLCGMLSVFFASAIMHGFFIMKALNITEFPVLFASYFLVNALVVILEKLMRSVLKRFGVYTRSPTFPVKVLLVLYTQTVVHILSHLLFWPDVVRLQFMPNLVDGVVQLGNRVVQTFQI